MTVKHLERRLLALPLKAVRLVASRRKRARADEDDEAPSAKGEEEKDDEEEAPKEEEENADEDDQEEESEGEDDKEESEDDDEEGESRGLEGYAAVFYSENDPGTEYELYNDPYGRMVERIAPGAFSRACREGDDCLGLFNHNPDQVLGRTSSGTLSLSEDKAGLRYRVDPLPDTQAGRDVAEMVGRGDVTGSSFGFVVEQQSWREVEEEGGRTLAIRTIEGVRLLDVGPVTYPAYAGTSASSRSGLPGAPVRAVGSVEEARSAYEAWKAAGRPGAEKLPLPAKLAAIRARAVQVGQLQESGKSG